MHKYYRQFLWASMALFILGLPLLFFIDRGDVVFWVNSWANEPLDGIFKIVTWIGAGWLFAVFILGMLFVRYYYAIVGVTTLFFVGLIAWFLKQIVFYDVYRPKKVFGLDSFDHIIESFDYHGMYSFPSGHTMGGFAFMTFLVYVFPGRWSPWLFLLLGIAIGFSRIYLLQHFYVDVYVGGMLGVLISSLGIWFYKTQTSWSESAKLNSSLLQKK